MKVDKGLPDLAVDVSIVCPCFNEGSNVDVLVERITATMAALEYSFELLLVDDGSSDDTWQRITEINSAQVRGVRLSRNFGHQHALFAGLMNCRGEAVISMDADLQHPPEVIPELLEQWRAGYKIVNTTRIDAEETSQFKKVTSKRFYQLFSSLSGVELREGSSDFRLLDRAVLASFSNFGDSDIFLRGMVAWVGFPTTWVPYQAANRYSGDSKYSLKKMLSFATSGVVFFSEKPLRLGIWVGLVTSFFAFLELLYVFVQYLRGEALPGWASTVGITALLFGVMFALLGFMGMYIAKIHAAVLGRPQFIVSEVSQNQHKPNEHKPEHSGSERDD